MRSTGRRSRTPRIALAACVTAIVTLSSGVAGADPWPSPNAVLEDVYCDLDGNGSFETYYETIGVGVAGHDADSTSINVGMSGTFTIYDEDGNIVRTGSVVTPGVGLPTTHCVWSADFESGGVTYHVEAEGELLITPEQG
jgi:hypothetical protein